MTAAAAAKVVSSAQDAERLPDIISDMRNSLDNDMTIDKRLPCFVGLSGFDDSACNLIFVAHTTSRAARDFGNWRQNLLLRMHKLVVARGGALTYPTQVRTALMHAMQIVFLLGHCRQNQCVGQHVLYKIHSLAFRRL